MIESTDNRPSDLEQRLAEWAQAEPAIDEVRLRRNLLERMGGRSRGRTPLVLAATAATVLAVLIGLESVRMRQTPEGGTSEVAYEPSENVILVLREGKRPIYLVTEPVKPGEGGAR
jgi:hypothetical protein